MILNDQSLKFLNMDWVSSILCSIKIYGMHLFFRIKELQINYLSQTKNAIKGQKYGLERFKALKLAIFWIKKPRIASNIRNSPILHIQGVHLYFGHFVFCNFSASKAPRMNILVLFEKLKNFDVRNVLNFENWFILRIRDFERVDSQKSI